MTDGSALAQEWQTLQQSHARVEHSVLWIKLAAVALCFISLAVVVDLLLVGVLIAILWLQEAIMRTSQARLGKRLLHLESLYVSDPMTPRAAFQLHTTWRASRGHGMALLAEYAASALRPTIAFPYVLLLLILLAALSTPPG
ncbi:MAG: hypothetical protein NVSMB6_28360 [Burkholderiaceae bacterium]